MEKTRRIDLRATENEYNLIQERMAKCKTNNMSAYMIKMAIDGMIINLDMTELREISKLLRYNGNNINQIAKRLNESKNIYAVDIDDIKQTQAEISEMVRQIYLKLAKI